MNPTLFVIAFILFITMENCNLFQKQGTVENSNSENSYLKIQDTYLTIESRGKNLYLVVDFLLQWKKRESLQLKIIDTESDSMLYENLIDTVPYLKIRSLPLDINDSKNSWLYENPDIDSNRNIKYIIETQNKELLYLNHNLLISKETKHSLIQKFNVR
jgi:hypothetical protein